MQWLRILAFILIMFAALFLSEFLAGVYTGLGLSKEPNPNGVMWGFLGVALWHILIAKRG